MLTARTKTGKKICLGVDYKKETLLYLRNKEEFLCPICGESVSLKLGDQRIFHFAHKKGGTCRDLFENESFYHMEGKRQLYQWLIRQKIPSVLEYYDREIQQRPDILFTDRGKKYALEFQCSAIPEKVFIKRTKTYLKNGYIPLWILSSNHIHNKKGNILALSNFHYFFLRATSSGKFYIPTYCPEKQLFHLVESITSYSVKNAFAHHSFYPLEKIELNNLLEPKLITQFNLTSWYMEIEKFKLNWSLHPGSMKNSFLHEIYNQNLNLFLLPSEIGLPVTDSLLIQTSPVIWQTYLYIDVLSKKKPGDVISLWEIEFFLKKRISRKEIIFRNLPQLEQVNPFVAISEYLFRLVQIGILTQKGEKIYQLERKILIPNSNREREEAQLFFYQKYQRILSKT